MALATTKFPITEDQAVGQMDRHSDQSAANTQLVVTTPTGVARRIIAVFVTYSATPTQSGITTELDSGLGAAYDWPLSVGSANARWGGYTPSGEVDIGSDDAVRVTAPAGGAGITSSISIYTKALG